MSYAARMNLLAVAAAVGLAAIVVGATSLADVGSLDGPNPLVGGAPLVIAAGSVIVVAAIVGIVVVMRRAPAPVQPSLQSRRRAARTMSVMALVAAILGGVLTVVGGVLESLVVVGAGLTALCASVASLGCAHGELAAIRMALGSPSPEVNARAVTGLFVARPVFLVGTIAAFVAVALPAFPARPLAGGLLFVFLAAYGYVRCRTSALLRVERPPTAVPDPGLEAGTS